MIDLVSFLLCFCSPSKAWIILCKMYENIVPSFAYPNNTNA